MATTAKQLYKLYVANIPWTIHHAELRKYFSKFGSVYAASVVFDKNTGLSKNYGFVQYTNQTDSNRAINEQNHKLEGNRLLVSYAAQGQKPANTFE